MRNLFLFLILALMLAQASKLSAAEDFDSLIQQGIEEHDKGNLQEAVEFYRKALEIEPESSLGHYEIAFSLYAAGELESAKEHCKKALEYGSGREKLPAYVVLASILDDSGEPEKACEVFEEAVNEFPDHYLLRFNYGLTLTRLGKLDKAEEMLKAGIALEPRHPTSHITLASIYKERARKVESIFPCYFFLLLEPNSPRSPLGFELLEEMYGFGVDEKLEDNERTSITINMNQDVENQNLMVLEFGLSLIQSTKLTKKEDITEFQSFEARHIKFLGTVFRMDLSDEDENLIWVEYAKILKRINENDYLDAMLCYISRSKNYPEAIEWMLENDDKMKEFEEWLHEEIFSDRDLFEIED
jgi:tetratricopeptide (TPR) repeat protein